MPTTKPTSCTTTPRPYASPRYRSSCRTRELAPPKSSASRRWAGSYWLHPVEGGSCSDYDYVCGDPINGRDLTGLRQKGKAERIGCALSWYLCWRASRAETWAKEATSRSGLTGPRANAFRHAILAAFLRWDVGTVAAKLILASHEFGRSPARAADNQADDDNNAVGLRIGGSETWHQREGTARRSIIDKATRALDEDTPWGRLNLNSDEG